MVVGDKRFGVVSYVIAGLHGPGAFSPRKVSYFPPGLGLHLVRFLK